MEAKQMILSKKNCHRAAIVRRIDDPDLGDFQFEWRGERINDNIMRPEFCHLARNPRWNVPTRIYDVDADMKNWEVVSWKYEVNFEDLWDVAYRGFSGTSFSPEERATQYIRGYEEALLDDLKQIPETEQGQYIAKFRDWVRTLFDKHSRIMSAMITGPANFPTRRNEKANNYYDSAVKEFGEWREKALKAIARRVEAAKPQEQKDDEAWDALRCDIGSSARTIIEINNGTNKYSYKPLFVSSIYGKVERIAKHGNVELVERAIAFIRELNAQCQKPILTERHKFFKLADVARAVRGSQTVQAEKDDRDIPFDGGVVRYNYAEDRLQILFNEKPGPEMISSLKHSGFRWSPRFGAWQRQLTSNAKYAAQRVLNIEIK